MRNKIGRASEDQIEERSREYWIAGGKIGTQHILIEK